MSTEKKEENACETAICHSILVKIIVQHLTISELTQYVDR